MTKISVVLYYWIAVAATLLFAKTAGLAENDGTIIKILIVVTVLYVGIVMASYKRAAKQSGNQGGGSGKKKAASPNRKGKRKNKSK